MKIIESAEKEISKIQLKDELFVKFVKLINSVELDLKNDESTLKAIEERWGLWLNDLNFEN